jgi:hypothetical protein
MASFKLAAALALLGALGGCATMTESGQQVLLVQTIQDNREVSGVGCVLTNEEGRWFVTTPGRVTVQKSPGKLWVDCRKGPAMAGQDVVASKSNTVTLIGNVVTTAGLGYFVDKRTGAGYDYPDTLTVIMQRAPGTVIPDGGDTRGNVVY